MTLTRAMLRGFLRDRTALFFTFFFPLMFLVVFGLIFNNASSSKTTIGVVGNGAIVQALPPERGRRARATRTRTPRWPPSARGHPRGGDPAG